MKTQKNIDKSTCEYAPLTHLRDPNLNDEQIRKLLETRNINIIEKMQIDDKDLDVFFKLQYQK